MIASDGALNMKHIDRASRPPGSCDRLHRIDFEILREIIHEHAGIFFQDSRKHVLQTRVMVRLQALGIDYFEDYIDYLTDPGNYSEILRLVDAITQTETAFFRTKDQFRCIREQLLPCLETHATQRARIWSTACATGEEAYSLAMLVAEVFPASKERPEIVASDINTQALYTAECGRYNARAMEPVPAALQNQHFSKSPEGFRVSEQLVDMVTFKRINLADRTDMMRMHSVNLILCMNVLQSFSKEIRQKTLQAIYNAMDDNAYLMIGATETLYGLSHPFVELNMGPVRVYQKCA
ncbi:MAG: protein-glutamate O-methyltransferase CheR [Bacteroidota bacterium]